MLVSHLRSIIAAEELNFCVRDENRCFLLAMGTEVRFPRPPLLNRQCGRNLASVSIRIDNDIPIRLSYLCPFLRAMIAKDIM